MINPQTQHLMSLVEFSAAKLEWCNEETARCIGAVIHSIESMNEHSQKLSEASPEAQQALESFSSAVKQGMSQNTQESVSSIILNILHTKITQSNELQTIIEPAVQAIQFEDRIRQNVENMIKMIRLWVKAREVAIEKNGFSQEDREAFGQQVMDNFVMQEERDIIKKHIPTLIDNNDTSNEIEFF